MILPILVVNQRGLLIIVEISAATVEEYTFICWATET